MIASVISANLGNHRDDEMISIIIAIYNYKYISNILTTMASLNQQDTEFEVIISDNSKTATQQIRDVCNRSNNTKYIFTPISRRGGNLGLARNKATKMSSGDYLCFLDADIVVYNKRHFSQLMHIAENKMNCVLIQPRMYRLVKNINAFRKDFQNRNEIDYNFGDNCLYKYSKGRFDALRELETEFEGQPYVCSEHEYKLTKELDLSRTEELFWKPRFHWGGIFCRKDYFEHVGGYSVKYHNWGCEDSDFISKLQSTYQVIRMYEKLPNLPILHLEHPRRYNNSDLKSNTRIFNNRKNKIETAIKEDIEEYKKL